MVDRTVLADKVAAVRDAVARIAEVLPATPEAFGSDRAVREIVTLNLFLALQDCIGLATHWLADAGWAVLIDQYGSLDIGRLFEIAGSQRSDLLAFCEQLAKRAAAEDAGV